jgi:alkanesulfonate monooxygenase SsuD/methylene tetrahydromethanopterin reductase-like flavin-dependent oxidoreductase (luciferase family)
MAAVGAAMQFCYFHLMPYTGKTTVTEDWPVANKHFDSALGRKLFATYLESMVQAERAGFDWLGCNEHHMSPYGMMANPNLVAASLIPLTRSAKLAILGSLVPILNPIRVAEEFAMLDVMSGGRVIAGLLRGIPHEYVAYNTPPDESYGRLEEAIALIKKAWTEPEPFGWEGEHYQFRAVSIWPKPMQKPHPRIVMSGNNEYSARLAARHGAVLGMATVVSIKQTRDTIAAYREEARGAGWEPTRDDIVVGIPLSIDRDPERAKSRLAEGRRYFAEVLGGGARTAQRIILQKTRFLDQSVKTPMISADSAARVTMDDLIDQGLVLCGTPAMVVQQFKRLVAEFGHGITIINLKVGNIPDDAIADGIKMFGNEVLPHIRHL